MTRTKYCLLFLSALLFAGCVKNIDYYYLTVRSNNPELGTATGSGNYSDGSEVTIAAYAADGAKFLCWNDGDLSSSRTVTVHGNATYTAFFAVDTGSHDEPPATTICTVQFGDSVWAHAYPDLTLIYTGNHVDCLAGQIFSKAYDVGNYNSDQWTYPYVFIRFDGTPVVGEGQFVMAADGWLTNGHSLAYYEDEGHPVYYQNGDVTLDMGDWCCRHAMYQITAFDATAHTVSFSIDATMYSSYEHFVLGTPIYSTETRKLKITMSNISFDEYHF